MLDHVVDERLAQLRPLPQHIRRQILQIDDLRAAAAQDLCEAVMLLLCAVEIGNIVEKQLLHGIGAEMLQLPSGSLQKHPFQRADFACYTDRHRRSSLLCFLECI